MDYAVHQLKTKFFNFTNYCYIIEDNATREAFIVDPAWEFDKVLGTLMQLDLHLAGILLTHSHYDHVGLVAPLLKRFNPLVYMSKAEIDYYGFGCPNLCALNDMDKITIGRTQVTCLLAPGHTVGGMCFLLKDSLFTGDTIFIEGCGACNQKGGSPEQMFDSIQRIKTIVQPSVHVYPGHSFGENPGRTMEYLLKENIYLQIDQKKYFVDFRMRKNQKRLFDFK